MNIIKLTIHRNLQITLSHSICSYGNTIEMYRGLHLLSVQNQNSCMAIPRYAYRPTTGPRTAAVPSILLAWRPTELPRVRPIIVH